jgi:hypothetical protein
MQTGTTGSCLVGWLQVGARSRLTFTLPWGDVRCCWMGWINLMDHRFAFWEIRFWDRSQFLGSFCVRPEEKVDWLLAESFVDDRVHMSDPFHFMSVKFSTVPTVVLRLAHSFRTGTMYYSITLLRRKIRSEVTYGAVRVMIVPVPY